MYRILLFALLSGVSFLTNAAEPPTQVNKIIFPEAIRLSEHTVRMPFKLIGRLIAVDATVKGESGPFIIDTGSYTTILNKRIYGNGKESGKSTYSVNHQLDEVEETIVDQLVLNRFTISGQKVDVIDLSSLERARKSAINGIIGYYHLKRYEIYIDFYLQQITLFETKSNGDRYDKYMLTDVVVDTLNFVRKRHGIILNTMIEGEKVKFALDTGAEINQLDQRVSASVLKYFTPLDRIELVGMDGKGKEVIAGHFDGSQFELMNNKKQMPTVITRLKHSREAFGTKVDGVLGYWFLKDKRILLNYKKRQLYFTEWPE